MKKLLFYLTMSAAIAFGGPSCKRADLDPDQSQPGTEGLSLRVSDAGFALRSKAAKGSKADPESKATEVGYKTVFEPKDEIGMTAIDVTDPANPKIIANFDNLKFVLQSDGKTWKPESDKFILQREKVQYIYYYPYNVRYDGSKSAEDVKVKHFAWVKGLPADEQFSVRDHKSYTARDLMIAQGDGSGLVPAPAPEPAWPGKVEFDVVRDVFTVELEHVMAGIELRFVSFYEGNTSASRTTVIEPDSLRGIKIGKPLTAKQAYMFYGIEAGVYRFLMVPDTTAGNEVELDVDYTDGAGTRQYQSDKFLLTDKEFAVNKPWQKVEIVDVTEPANTFVMQPKLDRAMLYRLPAIDVVNEFWGPNKDEVNRKGWGRIALGTMNNYIKKDDQWMSVIDWADFPVLYTDEYDGFDKSRIQIKQSKRVSAVTQPAATLPGEKIEGKWRVGVGNQETLNVQLAAGNYAGAATVHLRKRENANVSTDLLWSFNLWIPEAGIDVTQTITARNKATLEMMPLRIGATNDVDTTGVFQWGTPRMIAIKRRVYAEGEWADARNINTVLTGNASSMLLHITTPRFRVIAGGSWDPFDISTAVTGVAEKVSGQYGYNRWGGYNSVLGVDGGTNTAANQQNGNLLSRKTIFDPCPAGYIVMQGSVNDIASVFGNAIVANSFVASTKGGVAGATIFGVAGASDLFMRGMNSVQGSGDIDPNFVRISWLANPVSNNSGGVLNLGTLTSSGRSSGIPVLCVKGQ